MSEPFEPHVLREHKRMKGKLNKADGEYYIDDTIHWVIQQVRCLFSEFYDLTIC